jgi:biopolymer transport protein ExbD
MKSQRGAQICEINITPLTDIFLVLLVIMMVVTPMVNFAGLNLAVVTVGPATDTSEKPKTTLIEINAQGEYTVGGQLVPRDNLSDVLKARAADNPDGVLIEVHPDAAHESMAEAIAAVNRAGIEKVGVAGKELPPESTTQAPPKKPRPGAKK